MVQMKKSQSGLSRRSMLKATGVAAAGWTLGSAPALLHAQDRTGEREVVIGSGDHRYRCIHDWGISNLPDGYHYGGASHGVAIDEQGLIYVTHHGNPGSIFVFDPDGKFVMVMGQEHQNAEKTAGAGHGIDIRREGSEQFLYLSPNASHLPFAKMTLAGEIVWSRGRQEIHQDSGKYPNGAAYRPTNVSFTNDGGYFLGDGYGSHLIHQYDRNDAYVRTIGGKGTADGEFQTPHGQWLDTRNGVPLLVVCDRANQRLQWFDLDGNHVRTQGGFLFPADIDIRGSLMVVPDLHARITLLNQDNHVIVHLGDDEQWRQQVLDGTRMRGQRPNWKPGKFVHPHDACFDHEGNIYVAEWVVTGRVTKLERIK